MSINDGISGSYADRLAAKRKRELQAKMKRAIRDVVNNKSETVSEMIARWKSQNFKKEEQ